MMLIDWFIGLFSKTVYITLRKDKFIFETKDKTIILKTKMYVSDNDIILGVGDYYGDKNGVKKIDLFEKNEKDKHISKFEYLEKFFRHGFEELHNRKSFLRPRVIIQNVMELEEVLLGYENYLLKVAILQAGAREVYLIYKKHNNFFDKVQDMIKNGEK